MCMSLRELEVVVVDCQTTGATPDHGHLIELAWGVVSAACHEAADITCFNVRLPAGETLPGRIRSITGIIEEDLISGVQPAEAWRLLETSLRKPSGGWMIPVAHYSRFEKLWLESLWLLNGTEGPFSTRVRLHPRDSPEALPRASQEGSACTVRLPGPDHARAEESRGACRSHGIRMEQDGPEARSAGNRPSGETDRVAGRAASRCRRYSDLFPLPRGSALPPRGVQVLRRGRQTPLHREGDITQASGVELLHEEESRREDTRAGYLGQRS